MIVLNRDVWDCIVEQVRLRDAYIEKLKKELEWYKKAFRQCK